MTDKPRLLDQLREKIRVKHYSFRTEQAYVDWTKRFIRFHHMRHPSDMGPGEVEQFLNHLAIERNVTASTQNQALSALLFLYREVLGQDLGWLDDLERAAGSSACGADFGRGSRYSRSARWQTLVDGKPSLRGWSALDGVRSAQGQRCGL
jgi:hypothetical protein